ncbi:S8 family serine peptidase [Tateyamaria omphalii]|uniref:S8 family serine peptidase n=1 Tax=Tateyamaria omphalii TaxID=299262 RepID=UPI001C99C7F5|nr:S8 family serine peptidase [Tateyamaria omphalii]MBY5934725.1 S8 family serine peptidase [Tateyamaria omphalii]
MAVWLPNPDPDAVNIIDHVTYFRLSRAAHHYGADPDTIWWSVLVELEGISIDQFQTSVTAFADDLLIPAAYDAVDRSAVRPAQPVAIYARAPLVRHINDSRNALRVTSVLLGASAPERFLDRAAQSRDLPDVIVNDDAVVQAVIDDGIGIAHELFRSSATTTRIHHARIFEAEPLPGNLTSVGRGLDRADIDAFLQDCTFGDMLDEDLFYALSGQVDYGQGVFSTVAMRRSHGTHVMALAAGRSMDEQADTHPIICAALPSRIVNDTTGLEMVPVLYLAFHILVKQARRFRTQSGAPVPVVFNFSYGNTGGPHDGTGIFARLFDHYFGESADTRQKAWLTLPAGNANLERLHAVAEPRTEVDHTATLDLTVLPDDRTPTHVQIWLPNSPENAQPNFATISVRTPFGMDEGIIVTQPGQHAALVNKAGEQIAWLAYQYVGGQTQRGLVTLSTNPTANLRETSDLGPAGRWMIKLTRDPNVSTDPIHIWVRRDETLPGQTSGGRQAFFDNADYHRFDRYGAPLPIDPPDTTSPVRRSGTLSGFACGPAPIVVAAYTEQEAEMSVYSAAGPLVPSPHSPQPAREGPDIAAKGDDSFVLRGVISAGSRSGSWVRLAGTSVASPQVARLAGNAIHGKDDNARAWSREAAKRHRFDLRDDPSPNRVGAGAIRLPGDVARD